VQRRISLQRTLRQGPGLQQSSRRSPGSADPGLGDRHLRVGDIDLYAFSGTDAAADDVVLEAKLSFKCLKGSGADPTGHKTIPLKFLLLEMAAEDTLRILITLQLIDDVFRSWCDVKIFQ
jgi:hypothetical protein